MSLNILVYAVQFHNTVRAPHKIMLGEILQQIVLAPFLNNHKKKCDRPYVICTFDRL